MSGLVRLTRVSDRNVLASEIWQLRFRLMYTNFIASVREAMHASLRMPRPVRWLDVYMTLCL